MERTRTKQGTYIINIGSTTLEIFPGIDRTIPPTPVKIKFDGTFYNSKQGLINTVHAFDYDKTEDQLLQTLLELTE